MYYCYTPLHVLLLGICAFQLILDTSSSVLNYPTPTQNTNPNRGYNLR